MQTIEDIGTDPRNADGYVVLFTINDPIRTGVLVVPANTPKAALLRRLTKSISSHRKLSVELEGYQTERRTVRQGVSVYEIRFAVRTGADHLIAEFLEHARQTHVIEDPIVSDMRNFNP